MISSEAEKRRKRFLEEKKEQGGIDALINYHKEKDVAVIFNESGDILQIGEAHRDLQDGEKITYFTKEQVSIIKEHRLGDYKISQDPKDETVFFITIKPLESIYVKHEQSFITLVEKGQDENYDVKIEVFKNNTRVCLSDKLKAEYQDTKLQDATARGSKVLKFYFTRPRDPHFLVFSLNYNLYDLLSNDYMEQLTPTFLKDCSIYTIKLFDKYICS